jgi:hypothetical protein
MNAGERRLISLAVALIGDTARVSSAEAHHVATATSVDSHLI